MFTLAAGIDQASARVAVARANDRRLGQLAREGVILDAATPKRSDKKPTHG